MDEEIYYAQCVVYSLHTTRIGVFESCTQAEKLHEKYLTVFRSMLDELANFSSAQLAVYREIESEIMPIMQRSIYYMQMYQMFVGDCFDNNYRCLSLPIECETRSQELWDGVHETNKTLRTLNQLLEVIQDMFKEFLRLVRSLNVL